MPIVTFREGRSTTRDVRIIEVWYGNRFVATISPVDAGGNVVALNVISKYLDLGRVVLDPAEPPGLAVIFDLDRDA